MKGRPTVIALATVMVLVMACTVYAGPRGWGGCWGPGGKGGVLKDLSDDQRKQFSEQRLAFMKKIQPLRAEIGKKRIELMELASKDTPDEEAIQKKKEEIWALKDTIRNERRAFKTKMRSLLTPEQRKKLGPFGGGFGPGGGFGKGKRFGGGKGWGGGCPGWGGGCPGWGGGSANVL